VPRTPSDAERILRPFAQGAAFDELPAFYREVEGDLGIEGQRALGRVDRFYLLTRLCKRIDAAHPWLYDRCREVEADPDGCLDLWAREHYKSTFITFAGSIQEILRDPTITIGIFSHTAPIAKKFLAQIKSELETSAELKMLYPDVLFDRPDRDSPLWSVEKGIVVRRDSNPKEATVEAHGLVDSQPIGAHFSLLVYDDVVVPASVSTPDQVKKTTEMHSLSDNLGARGQTGMKRKWHIGTRYSFADTYGELLERKVLKPRIYPATEDGTRDGTPVFLSPEAWARVKVEQLPHILAAQMLQNPAAGNQALFKKEYLRFTDIRPSTLNIAILVDPASSKKKGSDNTAMSVIGIDAQRNRYLLDGYYHKMALSERWQRMRDLRAHWMRQPGIQQVKVGYERFGMNDGIEYFAERMEIEKISFLIQELAWPKDGPGSKYDRIQRMEPHFRAGRFYLIAKNTRTDEHGNEVFVETANQQRVREAGEEWRVLKPVQRIDQDKRPYWLNKVFLDEYLVYPFSKHDDFLDSASRFEDIELPPPVLVDEKTLEPEVG
jgi:hypothetical protein